MIVTNPPFGGMEEDGIESNFPSEFRTRETADLFALGDDLGFGLRSRLLLVVAVIWLAHVQTNMMVDSIGGKCNFCRYDHH